MKKATTIEEVYNLFDPSKPLDESTQEFYVDIYGDELKRFVTKLTYDKSTNKTYFLTGQSGVGKTTLLNILPIKYPKLKEKYEFLYINNCSNLLDSILELKYIDLSRKVTKSSYGVDSDWSTDNFNEINKSISLMTKELILVFNFDSTLDEKTLTNLIKLNKLKCRKIFNFSSITNITTKQKRNYEISIEDIKRKYFFANNDEAIRVFPSYNLDESLRLKLKDVLLQRTELELFEKGFFEKVVEYSRGNIRQFVEIIQESALVSMVNEYKQIPLHTFEEVIENIKKRYSSDVVEMKDILFEVENTSMVSDLSNKDIVNKAIRNNYIFQYYKNSVLWFGLNPIVRGILGVVDRKENIVFDVKAYGNKFINSLKIKNYFSIEEIELSNLKDKKEIYFVGENGDGKTILLQSIALAFKDFNESSVLAKEYLKSINDYIIEADEKFINNNLFGYGINRNTYSSQRVDDTGYAGLFDVPDIQAIERLYDPEKLISKNDSSIVKEFREKIEDIFDNKLKIVVEDGEVSFIENSKTIEFKMLSEGYKSTIIWLSDLLARLMENQKDVDKIGKFKAVVLVDEIDLYLHPKLKYSFVNSLRDIFPKIQFILSTHSIVTILGARKDAVFYKVYKDENGNTKISEQIDDISDYTANILTTSPIFGMESAKARAFDDNKNDLSSDDYKKHQLNQKIDEMLDNENDEKLKEDILKQLEEYNERI